MAILIKNAEVERRARELAALTGQTLTSAIDEAVKLRLARERAKPRPRRKLNVTKADFDEINEIPGLNEE
jgi:antitoxin VapB